MPNRSVVSDLAETRLFRKRVPEKDRAPHSGEPLPCTARRRKTSDPFELSPGFLYGSFRWSGRGLFLYPSQPAGQAVVEEEAFCQHQTHEERQSHRRLDQSRLDSVER